MREVAELVTRGVCTLEDADKAVTFGRAAVDVTIANHPPEIENTDESLVEYRYHYGQSGRVHLSAGLPIMNKRLRAEKKRIPLTVRIISWNCRSKPILHYSMTLRLINLVISNIPTLGL